MNTLLKRLSRLTDEELYGVSDRIDTELDRRNDKRLRRGYRRSTPMGIYMVDRVRGKRKAPRLARAA